MSAAASLASLSTGWLRRWLYALNAGLLVFAAGLALTISGRIAMFLAAMVPLTFVPFSYARLRLHQSIVTRLESLRPGSRAVFGLTLVPMLFDAVMIAQLLTSRSTTNPSFLQAAGISWIGPVWFSAHALLFLGYVLLAIARLVGHSGRRLIGSHARPPALDPPAGELFVGRRQFLQQFGLLGAGAPFIVSLGSIQLSYDFRVEERELTLPHWPKELDGMRIAHLSDIHVGGAMNRERLRHVAELTNAARPDIVLHTGDFLTHRVGDFDAPLYEALERIRAPFGQWASLGNHDYDQPDRLVRRLRDAGVDTLRNRLVRLDVGGRPLELGGIDFVYPRAARGEVTRGVIAEWPGRDGAARVILCHDPGPFFDLAQGCGDLVLSGHMHGGQIGIQLGSAHALTLVGLFGVPDQGVFANGDLRMYVTRCVGFYGYPMRVGIPPEIAMLTLRAPRA